MKKKCRSFFLLSAMTVAVFMVSTPAPGLESTDQGAVYLGDLITFGSNHDGDGGFEYFGDLNVTNTFLTTNVNAVTFGN